MAIVVQVVGLLMLLGGLVGLVYGIDMLPTERGIAGTISSTVALTGGVLTTALGVLIVRVEAVRIAFSQGPRAVAAPKIKVDEPPRARLDPVVAQPPVAPPPVAPEMPAIEPFTPSVTIPEVKLPDIRLPDIRVPDVVPAEPKPAPQADKPRFKLPSFRLGGGAAAAGAAAAGALAGAAVAKASDAVRETAENAAEVVDDALMTVAPLAKPDPVDPPVEVLTPVEDAPLVDLKAEDVPPLLPEVDAAAYASVPLPEAVAEKPAADDPFAAFDAELDKLIPLRTTRKAKGKKDSAPEELAPPPVEETAVPEPQPEPQPEPAQEPIPAEVYADPSDLEPPPPAPAPGAEVVGAYESGGAKYTMYSDGSVVAEAEGQQLFFRSLEELRQFIDGGVKG